MGLKDRVDDEKVGREAKMAKAARSGQAKGIEETTAKALALQEQRDMKTQLAVEAMAQKSKDRAKMAYHEGRRAAQSPEQNLMEDLVADERRVMQDKAMLDNDVALGMVPPEQGGQNIPESDVQGTLVPKDELAKLQEEQLMYEIAASEGIDPENMSPEEQQYIGSKIQESMTLQEPVEDGGGYGANISPQEAEAYAIANAPKMGSGQIPMPEARDPRTMHRDGNRTTQGAMDLFDLVMKRNQPQ